MEIRKIKKTDDFDAIASIYVRSWRETYVGIVPQTYLDNLSVNHWAPLLQDGPFESFVIVDEGSYMGTCSVCPARDEAMKGWGEIVSLYLAPEYERQGFGSVLLEVALEELEKQGYRDVYLWTLRDNVSAIQFYERYGFRKTIDTLTMTIEDKELEEVRYVYHRPEEAAE